MVFSDIKEAWDFLILYPYKKYTVGYITYFEWYFYDKDRNTYKLEHQVGMVKSMIKNYNINTWILIKNCKEHCVIEDIVALINLYKDDIEKTEEYFNKNELLKSNLVDILGNYTSYINDKITWNLVFEKIKLKIVFFMYVDNENVKNILLDVLENNKKEWKKTNVDKTELWTFLEKNKRKIAVKTSYRDEKELVEKVKKISLKRNVEEDKDDELIEKFSKIKITRHKNMSKIYSDISNTYAKLFIKMDKEKKYQIQACKKF